jgi:hypothetical protein
MGAGGVPARESVHGLPGLAVKKAKLKQARLRKFSFFESHIRATNAPARRIPIF